MKSTENKNMKQVSIPFNEWDLIAWVNEKSGDTLVAVKPIIEAIGLKWSTQHRKLVNDPKYRCHHMGIPSAGGIQETLALPTRQINGLLYGISSRKVKPEIRERLLKFQEECHIKLHDHFSGKDKDVSNSKDEEIVLLKELVSSLQDTIKTMGTSILQMSEDIRLLRTSQADSDQAEASESGRRLNRSKKTKILRDSIN